ncbi:hypothetical protein K7432_004523 [Basidiobolus ranarum]|uniref:Uncharacterized protein n=1 Tax=Basidiobolus ranarum TaxID=34480 RepID=A0ABR2WY50_9FUNG
MSFTLINVNAQQIQAETNQIDSVDPFSLHKQLVDIESISGNEVKVGDSLSSYLESYGLTEALFGPCHYSFANSTSDPNANCYRGKQRAMKFLMKQWKVV